MVTTAFQVFAFAVLASRLIAEFGLSRFEIGLIGSLNTAVGALSAPLTGRFTDRIGARQATIAAQLIAAAGLSVMALAGSTSMLIVSAVILGLPQGWGNPATNALIAERVEPGRRGTVTGIKQSGVTFGVFLAGATLPSLSDGFGTWRGAIWVYAGVAFVFGLVPLLLPRHATERFAEPTIEGDAENDAAANARSHMRRIRQLALYAFLMGTAGGAMSRFLALFAEEEAGMSNATAGFVVALSGLFGMASRIVAGKLAEHRIAPLRLLAILAVIGMSASLLLMVTTSVGAWVLWPVALLIAIGHAAWNAVAMLAIIIGVPKSQAGRASGTVMFGFLSGLAVGAPLAGLLIDATGSYQPLFIGATLLAAIAAFSVRPRSAT